MANIMSTKQGIKTVTDVCTYLVSIFFSNMAYG